MQQTGYSLFKKRSVLPVLAMLASLVLHAAMLLPELHQESENALSTIRVQVSYRSIITAETSSAAKSEPITQNDPVSEVLETKSSTINVDKEIVLTKTSTRAVSSLIQREVASKNSLKPTNQEGEYQLASKQEMSSSSEKTNSLDAAIKQSELLNDIPVLLNASLADSKSKVDLSPISASLEATNNEIKEQEVTQEDQSTETLSNTIPESSSPRYTLGSKNNPIPEYPHLAIRRGWQGEVILGVHVNPDGSIKHLTFVKSTNYGVLNFEAYETVRTSWHFLPIEEDSEPSSTSYIEVPILFQLANR